MWCRSPFVRIPTIFVSVLRKTSDLPAARLSTGQVAFWNNPSANLQTRMDTNAHEWTRMDTKCILYNFNDHSRMSFVFFGHHEGKTDKYTEAYHWCVQPSLCEADHLISLTRNISRCVNFMEKSLASGLRLQTFRNSSNFRIKLLLWSKNSL